jgi:hypothetical protein
MRVTVPKMNALSKVNQVLLDWLAAKCTKKEDTRASSLSATDLNSEIERC